MTGKFEIDDDGFKTQMSEVPLWRLIQEIISNSFDEDSVKKIDCSVTEQEDQFKIIVEDDGLGFRNIKDIFTLYGDSYKRTNPEQSGRYNEGEKRFLAVAVNGYVETKDIRIEFGEKTRSETKIPKRNGTIVCGVFNKKDFEYEKLNDIIKNIKRVAVPNGKELFINGTDKVEPKTLVKKFKAELRTVKSNGANQKLVQVIRETDVFLYEKDENERPLIYERGIPVQELQENLLWHVDVRQKIPQTTDRNVVSDKYLHRLYAEITANTIDLIDDKDSNSNWISDGLKVATPQVAKEIFKKRYGTDQVMIRSTTDSEANERAEESGVVLIQGKDLDPEVRENLKKINVLKFAGQEFQTDHFETAKKVIPTEKMIFFAEVVKEVARDTIKKEIQVNFITTKKTDEYAQYGNCVMDWNVRMCGGMSAFDITSPKLLATMTHELSHDKLGANEGHAHLSMDFIREGFRIAGIIESKGIQYYIDKVKNND